MTPSSHHSLDISVLPFHALFPEMSLQCYHIGFLNFVFNFSLVIQSPDSAFVILMGQFQCVKVYFICLSEFVRFLEDAINHMV